MVVIAGGATLIARSLHQTKVAIVGDPRFKSDIASSNLYTADQLTDFARKMQFNEDLLKAVDSMIKNGESFEVSSGNVKYSGRVKSDGLYELTSSNKIERAK